MDPLKPSGFPFELVSERQAREAYEPGVSCPDGGSCHHRCAAKTGCSRAQGCSPFSDSGLSVDWTPLPNAQESARREALTLQAELSDQLAPAPARSKPAL